MTAMRQMCAAGALLFSSEKQFRRVRAHVRGLTPFSAAENKLIRSSSSSRYTTVGRKSGRCDFGKALGRPAVRCRHADVTP